MAGNGAMFIVFAISAVVGACLLVTLVIWLLMRFGRSRQKAGGETVTEYPRARIAVTLVTVFVPLFSAVAWISNMGWLRVFVLWMFPVLFVPLVYTVFLWILMRKSVPFVRQLKIHMLCTYVLFFASFAFIPDFGDIGDPYMFFMLIQHDSVPLIGFGITAAALIGCIVSMVLQFGRLKKLRAASAEEETPVPADPTE